MKLTAADIKSKLEAGRDYKAPDLAGLVLNNKLESALFKFSVDKDPLLSNRAMWILWHCSMIDYDRIKPFLEKLILHLEDKTIPSGVVRCILSLFQEKTVPEKYHSYMLDKCYGYIVNSAEAIAVRAFAMTVAFNISKNYPDLMRELEAILQHIPISEESPAIKARTKDTLKLIQKYKAGLKRQP